MRIIYFKSDDATGVSQLARGIASVKYPEATIVDTKGKDNTAMAALVSGISDDTYDDLIICIPLVDTHAAGKFTVAQAQSLIAKLKTANQGTNVAGDCQTNSTKMVIKIAAGTSAVNNFYRLMIIITAGVTAITRLITAYNGTTKLCTVADTGTAITDTETYTIYTTSHLHIIGEKVVDDIAPVVAWQDLFPLIAQQPEIVQYLNNLATLYHKVGKTATGIAAGTLTDTGEFVSGAYTDGDYYVAVESATTGGGQVMLIASNTADVLTLDRNWDITPTGTVVYQIVQMPRVDRALWNKFLPYAIATYLSGSDDVTTKEFGKLVDKYGHLKDNKTKYYQNRALLEEYIAKGKCIFEGVCMGIVS